MSQLPWLDFDDITFPDTSHALKDPNGLLAVGGNLSVARLIHAYRRGIFPWYSDNQPILWWTPDPRLVLLPQHLHVSRTVKKLSRKKIFTITVDSQFERVIENCAGIPRRDFGTWITPEIKTAYCALHRLGFAHSVEAWCNDELVGGLYGVSLGKMFFGESMFSSISGASKIAFATLCLQLQQWQFLAIDCQIKTDYLSSFGAREISRQQFEALLAEAITDYDVRIDVRQSQYDWKSHWRMPPFGFADGNP